MATDLRRLCRKLLQALSIQYGRRISMSQYQSYSARAGRTVTKYILSEQCPGGGYAKLLESWSLPDVVKRLAEELERSRAGDVPEDGTRES